MDRRYADLLEGTSAPVFGRTGNLDGLVCTAVKRMPGIQQAVPAIWAKPGRLFCTRESLPFMLYLSEVPEKGVVGTQRWARFWYRKAAAAGPACFGKNCLVTQNKMQNRVRTPLLTASPRVPSSRFVSQAIVQ